MFDGELKVIVIIITEVLIIYLLHILVLLENLDSLI